MNSTFFLGESSMIETNPFPKERAGNNVPFLDQVGNYVPIWDGFSFRANGQRSYSPVRRAGKIVAHNDLLFGLKGRDCGPSGLNQTFAALKNRPFGPGFRITPLQVEI